MNHHAGVGRRNRPDTSVDRHAAALRSDPLYLDRCQVDTPPYLVALAWDQVNARRDHVATVVDFGAGDARFSEFGTFESYTGYEVDARRCAHVKPRPNVTMIERCAFSHRDQGADVCIGNPPYARNQDLPAGWRQMAASEVLERTGVSLSGLANAWQYFLMLALWSVKHDGLVVQVLPFEWVSRPAVAPIRRYIDAHRWSVDVYRLADGVFDSVLTAASITVIDKKAMSGRWRFHELRADGLPKRLSTPTGAATGVLPYRSMRSGTGPRAKRGLSPGTQQVLTLTEGERVHAGLRVQTDVVRCVTSLRPIPADVDVLSVAAFDEHLLSMGAKCWLIRTDREPSSRLRAYLDAVDSATYETATCLGREAWWRFAMPQATPRVLVAQAFKGNAPKAVINDVGAVAVGGVAGIYDVDDEQAAVLIRQLAQLKLHERLVPYAKQMHKLEINQLNALLLSALQTDARSHDR